VIKRLVAAAVMLVLAVVLVLVARDAWHWSRAMRDADARASLGYVPPEAWNAHTTLPSHFVRRLLGVDDDLTFRQAAMAAQRQFANIPSTSQQLQQRTILESALARISRDDPDHVRAAAAADDLGALLYFDPPSPGNAQNPYQDPTLAPSSGDATPSEKALAQFELAVRLNPANANAQKNLEVMLREAKASPKNQTNRVGVGERLGTKGSGSRLPGHGY
jgi:hypothetical protein